MMLRLMFYDRKRFTHTKCGCEDSNTKGKRSELHGPESALLSYTVAWQGVLKNTKDSRLTDVALKTDSMH